MIITQSNQTRRFTGCLTPGSDVGESLIDMCLRQNIKCGFFRGSGYLKTVKLLNYDPEKKTYESIETLMGPFIAPIINGNISLRDNELFCELFAVIGSLRKDRMYDLPRCVHLAGGEIISFEFTLTTFDDIVLIRDIDKKTGLYQWLFVEQQSEKREKALKVESSSFEKIKEKEDFFSDVILNEVREGDFLNHPKLGMCKVLHPPLESKIPVALKSGKTVELHLSLLKLNPPQLAGAVRVFPVEVKKK